MWAIRRSFVSIRRVVEIGLDGRRRASEQPGDLPDRETLRIAVVAGKRRSPAPFMHTITGEQSELETDGAFVVRAYESAA